MGDRSDTDSVREAVRDYKEGDVVEVCGFQHASPLLFAAPLFH